MWYRCIFCVQRSPKNLKQKLSDSKFREVDAFFRTGSALAYGLRQSVKESTYVLSVPLHKYFFLF